MYISSANTAEFQPMKSVVVVAYLWSRTRYLTISQTIVDGVAICLIILQAEEFQFAVLRFSDVSHCPVNGIIDVNLGFILVSYNCWK